MKISFIITSFNQKKRLFYSLQSAIHQKVNDDSEYEIILADDNSTDGTIEMVKKYFPSVKISINDKSIAGKFTTCTNKNKAVTIAEGERLVFSNGDVLFSSNFIDSYFNPIWQDNIVFGPCERSDKKIEKYIEPILIKINDKNIETRLFKNYKDLVRLLSEKEWIYPDPHHDNSVYTYNQKYTPIYPWGGNMSVMKEHFMEVKGFPEYDYYGGEESALCIKITEKFNVNTVSNNKAYSLHLWHPQYNQDGIKYRPEYLL